MSLQDTSCPDSDLQAVDGPRWSYVRHRPTLKLDLPNQKTKTRPPRLAVYVQQTNIRAGGVATWIRHVGEQAGGRLVCLWLITHAYHSVGEALIAEACWKWILDGASSKGLLPII